MSIDDDDVARDEMYERLSEEMYAEHKARAIEEFSAVRLRSYYEANSMLMRPAVDAFQQAKRLSCDSYHAAAVVFYVTSIELFLKATVLKPVVHGLVHLPGLAEVIVEATVKQPGFDRYSKLLAKIYKEIAGLDLATIKRPDAATGLMKECEGLQDFRNGVIHRGEGATESDSLLAQDVATSVFDSVVLPLIDALGLSIADRGEIVIA